MSGRAASAAGAARGFAECFRGARLRLPASAIADRADGFLTTRGWSVRWRWRDREALEVRSSHRLDVEMWATFSADGGMVRRDVPPEMFVVPSDPAERVRAETAYSVAWRRHGEAVEDRGMEFDKPPASLGHAYTDVAWRVDGMPWHVEAELTD